MITATQRWEFRRETFEILSLTSSHMQKIGTSPLLQGMPEAGRNAHPFAKSAKGWVTPRAVAPSLSRFLRLGEEFDLCDPIQSPRPVSAKDAETRTGQSTE
jgi:hypothetical protein